jgi:hypothetical protein
MSEIDWRLDSPIEELLGGATFSWRRWSELVRAAQTFVHEWKHDHCELCWATFGVSDEIPRRLTFGYVADGGELRRWICADCFGDFRERFDWRVVGPEPLH